VLEDGAARIVGTRVIAAMRIDEHPDDPSWYNGPPTRWQNVSSMHMTRNGVTPLPLPRPGLIVLALTLIDDNCLLY